MDAGSLSQWIEIQRRSQGEDEIGQPIDSWERFAAVWANPKGTTGMGTITRQQQGVAASINAYSFRIRFLEGITDDMRVVLNGVPFDIRQIRMDYANRDWTDLICEQGGNDG